MNGYADDLAAVIDALISKMSRLPREVFDANRAGVAGDHSQFYKDLAVQFYGANRRGRVVREFTLVMRIGVR